MRRYTLRVVTSAFTGHRAVLGGEERQCQFNFLKVSTKKTGENIFQHDSYGAFSKLVHKSRVTARWQ